MQNEKALFCLWTLHLRTHSGNNIDEEHYSVLKASSARKYSWSYTGVVEKNAGKEKAFFRGGFHVFVVCCRVTEGKLIRACSFSEFRVFHFSCFNFPGWTQPRQLIQSLKRYTHVLFTAIYNEFVPGDFWEIMITTNKGPQKRLVRLNVLQNLLLFPKSRVFMSGTYSANFSFNLLGFFLKAYDWSSHWNAFLCNVRR